ncbi:MAG: potassium channel family protein [Cellulomonas sp.]
MPEVDSIESQLLSFLGRTSLMLALLTCSYYVLPTGGLLEDPSAVLRSVGFLLALAGFVIVLRIQLNARKARRTVWTRAEGLLTALYLLILVFALVYDRIAVLSPDQITGIGNRTDALYFTVTIVSTVGFGDIHATGSAARMLVTVQMLINLVYVGTALRVLSNLHDPPDRPTDPDGQPAHERSAAPDP